MSPLGGAALAVAAVAALVDWWSRWRHDERLEQVAKPLTTAAVVVLAAVDGSGPARWWVVGALVACLVGDVALLPAVDRFIAGLASFLVGHLLVVVAAVARGFDRPWVSLPVAVVLGALLVGVGPPVVAGARRRAGAALAAAVAAYLAVIGVMTLAVAATGALLAVAGALVFAVSDAILGWNRFVSPLRWSPVAIMVTYHLALVLLAFGLAVA